MRKSVVDTASGLVVNVVELEEDFALPDGYEFGPDAEIGDSIVNGEVIKPPPPEVEPVPLTLTQELEALFVSLPLELQAALGPLAATVDLFMSKNNPAAAKLVIAGATIPAELEELRAAMLGKFDA